MKHPVFKLHILLLFFIFFFCNSKGQKITDTIFYNNRWEICEKPMAAFYRIGTLAIDSFWFYTGRIYDFNMKDTLLMEGEYTEDGYKDGEFKFYYSDGSLMLEAYYNRNQITGIWKWYYLDNGLQAVIDFTEGLNNFKFLFYRTPFGDTSLSNGSGSFEWYTNPIPTTGTYLVKGKFLNGKRSGDWQYNWIDSYGKPKLSFTEKYDDNGNYKKTITTPTYLFNTPKSIFIGYQFNPVKIQITENMKYDNLFRKIDPENSDLALRNFLLNGGRSEIIVTGKNFEEALVFILKSLEKIRGKIEYQQKEVNATIRFKIGDYGFPEDISIKGDGLTEAEQKFLIFYLSKFKEIEMPVVENVAFEGYHNIHLFSLNMKEYVPALIRDQVNNDLFFTTLTKDQFSTILRSKKKEIKKYIREEFIYYW